jgi:hypothetical protein
LVDLKFFFGFFKQNKRDEQRKDKSIAIKFTTGVLIETNFDWNKEK